MRRLLVAAGTLLLLAASSAGGAPRRVAVIGIGGGLVPGFNDALSCCTFGIGYLAGTDEAIRGAFRQTATGTWANDLVTSARADTKRLSFTIDPSASWYWGGRKIPVTYRDFVYTLQQIDDPSNDVSDRTGYANLDPDHFTHRGEKQVTFFWKTKDCSADFPCRPFANWQSLFSRVFPSAALAGVDFGNSWRSCVCGSDGKPVSDGPFYLASYTPGQGMTLESNPYWDGRKPGLAEIDFRIVLDPTTLFQAMRLGSVDAMGGTLSPEVQPLAGVPGITIDPYSSYNLEHLEFREGKGSSNVLLRAPWMRQAIALALDRRAIIRGNFGQLAARIGPVENLLFFPNESGYRPDFGRWDYDPAKALAILEAHCSGGPSTPSPGNDRVWQCGGLPATIRWTWTAGNQNRTAVEQLAKAELKAVGIAVVERPLPGNVIFGSSGLPSGDFDVAEFALDTSGDPGDLAAAWSCNGDNNWTGFCSAKADAFVRAGASELDPVKRAADYRAADAILSVGLPAFPLYAAPGVWIHKTDLLGMHPGLPLFFTTEDWHWRS
jgi:ABC-type transport system substrate-binding protein